MALPDRHPPVAVAVLVLAAVLSGSAAAAPGPAGQVLGEGQAPRIAIGGADARGTVEGQAGPDARPTTSSTGWTRQTEQRVAAGEFKPITRPAPVEPEPPYATYDVRKGDTLVGIAEHYGISMMTIWWANDLTSKDLRIGQRLLVPAFDGLLVAIEADDSVGSLAAKFGVDASRIREVNGLGVGSTVREGQRVLVPGARGAPIKPSESEDEAGRDARWRWPVAGGHLTQRYGGDHYALDIAADPGTRVVAARPGKVLFAGWRNNCGGYQVWVRQDDGLSTTYNHLSSVSVGAGQRIAGGQTVGRVGSSGCVTGPHVHFEVWKGPIWNGGRRLDPGSFY